MTQRKPSATDAAQRATTPPLLPTGRADLRGPRVLDPFACETLAYPRLSPLEVPGEPVDEPTRMRPAFDPRARIGVPCEPLDEPTLMRPGIDPRAAMGAPREPPEEPTVVYRPWVRALALKASTPAADASLAKTIAQPVLAPMALRAASALAAPGVRAPVPRAVPRASEPAVPRPPAVGRAAARQSVASTARTPLLRKCIAGLVLIALALLGMRALSKRHQSQATKTAAAAVSASSRASTAASGSPSASVVATDDRPPNADVGPPPIVNGKTAQRQAVDLIARGAYSEAAALYDWLARSSDVPAFREAARIAQRKARPSK